MGANFWKQFFRGALLAAGLMVGGGNLLAQEEAVGTILPQYPTSKRHIAASDALEATSAAPATNLKWRTAARPLPQRSAKIEHGEVQQASMNLRVGASPSSGVSRAVNLVPAETIVASSPVAEAATNSSSVVQTQARSRFQPSLDPPSRPSRLPSTTAPDVIDGDPGFGGDEPSADPLFNQPLTGDLERDLPETNEPGFELPETGDPAPAELPPMEEGLPDPGASRNFGLGGGNGREQTPCRENYRDTNCCEQNNDCRYAWSRLENNPVRLFTKGFLDITPLYHPDVRYADKTPIDQEKAREAGLALGVLRLWKNTAGSPLGLSEDGSVLGLDGADWMREWEDASRDGDMGIGGDRELRPAELKGRVTNYRRGASEVTIVTEAGDELTLELKQLSIDDNEWLNGRQWRDAEGRVLAVGRFHDYEWNRILVMQDNGRVVAVPFGKLGDNDLCYVGAYWGEGVGLPAECRLRGEMKIRNFTMLTYTWKASGLCHKPLYFEEVQLERYGHTFGPVAQPIVSGAHFFANIAILPYKMGINPPNECQYALGYYRPGDCAPYMIPPVPLSVRGGLYQAGAVVGAVALFP